MPVVVTERFPSRNGVTSDASTTDLHYLVTGTDSDVTATSNVLSTAPATYNNRVIKAVSVDQVNNQTWYSVVSYGLRKYPETGESSYNFDFGGATQHITQSLETMQSMGIGGSATDVPDYEGAIADRGDGPEGVDIPVPQYRFTETHYIAVASVTDAYKGKLHALTGKTNDAVFRNFAIGEVQFLGAAGSQRGEEDWEITFRFAASENKTGLTVGSITGINKKGWEYLWVGYEMVVNTSPKTLVHRPVFTKVERVLEAGDFTDLGI